MIRDIRDIVKDFKISKHFRFYEFLTPRSQAFPVQEGQVIIRTMGEHQLCISIEECIRMASFWAGVLEMIRSHFGNNAIVITSALRTWIHLIKIYEDINRARALQGKPPLLVPEKSFHLFFGAIDFKVLNIPARDVQYHLEKAWFGRVLKYGTFTHIDLGG